MVSMYRIRKEETASGTRYLVDYRDSAQAMLQLTKELLGCHLIPAPLHQDIQDVPLLIHGAP